MTQEERDAVYRLWCKFHTETVCGDVPVPNHWSECHAVTHVLLAAGVPPEHMMGIGRLGNKTHKWHHRLKSTKLADIGLEVAQHVVGNKIIDLCDESELSIAEMLVIFVDLANSLTIAIQKQGEEHEPRTTN